MKASVYSPTCLPTTLFQGRHALHHATQCATTMHDVPITGTKISRFSNTFRTNTHNSPQAPSSYNIRLPHGLRHARFHHLKYPPRTPLHTTDHLIFTHSHSVSTPKFKSCIVKTHLINFSPHVTTFFSAHTRVPEHALLFTPPHSEIRRYPSVTL